MYLYLHKQMRSHDTVSKFAYVSICTYVLLSKVVHVNGASSYEFIKRAFVEFNKFNMK